MKLHHVNDDGRPTEARGRWERRGFYEMEGKYEKQRACKSEKNLEEINCSTVAGVSVGSFKLTYPLFREKSTSI